MDPYMGVPLAGLGGAIREACSRRRLHGRTSYLYVCWARRFIMFHGNTHPDRLGPAHIRAFLSDLTEQRLSPSSLRQALLSIRFLYQHVLGRPLPEHALTAMRARRPRQRIGSTLPSRLEIEQTIARLHGIPRHVAVLQYGCGLRLREVIALRLIDLDGRYLLVGERRLALPASAIADLESHREVRVRTGAASSDLLFVNGQRPLSEQSIQRAYRATGSGLTPRALRVAFAMHLIEQGVNLRQLQELMGLRDVRTTERYLGLTTCGPGGAVSPLDDRRCYPTAECLQI